MPHEDNLGSDGMAFEGSNYDNEINELSKHRQSTSKSKKKGPTVSASSDK